MLVELLDCLTCDPAVVVNVLPLVVEDIAMKFLAAFLALDKCPTCVPKTWGRVLAVGVARQEPVNRLVAIASG